MVIIRMKEIRRLNSDDRVKRLNKYRRELTEKYSQLSAGGSIDNPARIKELRRTIARFLTVMNEK